MNTMRYVVYCEDFGIEYFDTKEEAVKFAQKEFRSTGKDGPEEFIAEVIPHKFELIVE